MTNTMFDTLLEAIATADIITIFRHEHPDCDALGSQWGLYSWIKDNFPEKKVYALGYESTTQCDFLVGDVVSDEVIANSTAIVLDTANTARIDDARSGLGVRAERLEAEVEDERPHNRVEQACCKHAPNAETGAYLVSKGIDVADVNRDLFDVPYAVFTFQNALRSKVTFEDGIAYAIFTKEDLAKWHMTGGQARNYIDELGHVREFEVWAIFTESDEHPGLYHGSLRSKHVIINEIAQQFNGGGHPNASGVKNLTKEDIEAILIELHKAIHA